jgi:hypothetical protein
MLIAHIDDSGSNKQGPIMVLAGYVARLTRWMGFNEEWQTALDEKPKLAYFKIKEAIRLEEQFGRFKPEQRDDRVFKLCSIIQKYVDFGVVASFKWSVFQQAQSVAPRTFFQPYGTLFHGMMSGVLNRILDADPYARLLFVFDEQGAAGHLASKIFDAIFPELNPREQKALMGVSHLSDQDVLPLQAADCLAWLMRRHAQDHPNCDEDLADWEPPKPYLEPLRPIPRLHTYYPIERFRNILRMHAKELDDREKMKRDAKKQL